MSGVSSSYNGCLIAIGAGLMAFPGCGQRSAFERVVVRGTVTHDGKPLGNGKIRFTPLPGTAGPANVAGIEHGTYELSARGGVQVGKHRVHIIAYQGTGLTEVEGMTIAAQELELSSTDYTHSPLELEVPAGSETLTQDFVLTATSPGFIQNEREE